MQRLNFAEFGNNDRVHNTISFLLIIPSQRMFKLHVFIFVEMICAKHLMVYLSFENAYCLNLLPFNVTRSSVYISFHLWFKFIKHVI